MVTQPSRWRDASFSSLAALVEKSLVQMESADRFGMHELLRQYGMEQLEAYGETEATYARHSQLLCPADASARSGAANNRSSSKQCRRLNAISTISAWPGSGRRSIST